MNRDPVVYKRVVTADDTAAAVDPRLPPAASTPFVLTMVENVCIAAIQDELSEDEVTVGAHVSLDHLKPTPVGATLDARATLESSADRRYTWAVEVYEEDELAARARHVRVRVPKAVIRARLDAARGLRSESERDDAQAFPGS